MPSGELAAAVVPAGAPCYAALDCLTLSGQNLLAFLAGTLAMTRLALLDLSLCCFKQLPEGVSVLTALQVPRLGRHPTGEPCIGGGFGAQALGSLTGFPRLRSLCLNNCRVDVAPSFGAAAAHPRLKRVVPRTAYPAVGPSSVAFLTFVSGLLQPTGGARTHCACAAAPSRVGGSRKAGGSRLPYWSSGLRRKT